MSKNASIRPIMLAVLAVGAVDFVLWRVVEQFNRDFSADPWWSAIVSGILYGFLWSQSLLLCIWGVFGPQSLAVRTAGAVLACGFLWIVNSLPVQWERLNTWYLDGLVSMFAVLPAFFVVSTATMWPFRALRGWCIAHRDMDQTGRAFRFGQFGIFDLLVVTALVAVVLGAYQFRDGFNSARDVNEIVIDFDDYDV
jgi:hypothetical protein